VLVVVDANGTIEVAKSGAASVYVAKRLVVDVEDLELADLYLRLKLPKFVQPLMKMLRCVEAGGFYNAEEQEHWDWQKASLAALKEIGKELRSANDKPKSVGKRK